MAETLARRPAPTLVSAPGGSDPQVAEVESLVTEFIGCYERLLELARRRHEAMRRARPREMAECIGEEATIVQRIAELEARRLRLVGAIAERLQSSNGRYTRLSWIAERMEDPVRSRMIAQAARLRELIEAVQSENATVGAAARALALHMEGLMKQLAARHNHSRTYGRKGSVEAGPAVTSAIDVRS
ncbi:MAG TPA: flagellar protein FlgN [Phycisphaerales bacterium]|nr:flagellar protein FlgN [Phycisphaerales bacterium]